MKLVLTLVSNECENNQSLLAVRYKYDKNRKAI